MCYLCLRTFRYPSPKSKQTPASSPSASRICERPRGKMLINSLFSKYKDPRRDLLGVHEVDRTLGRPLGNNSARGIAAMSGQRARIEGRHDMLVNVNTMRKAHFLSPVLFS